MSDKHLHLMEEKPSVHSPIKNRADSFKKSRVDKKCLLKAVPSGMEVESLNS